MAGEQGGKGKVTDGDRVMGRGLCVTRVVCGWGVVVSMYPCECILAGLVCVYACMYC